MERQVLFDIDSGMMPIALVYFIPAAISVIAFFYILLKIHKTSTAKIFMLFVGVSFFWQLSEGFMRISNSFETAMFWHKLLSILVFLCIATGFHFALHFVKNEKVLNSWWLPLGVYLPAISFILGHVLEIDIWYVAPHPTLNWISDSEFTIFDRVEVVWMVIVAFAFMYQMAKYAWLSRRKEGVEKSKAIIMFLGFFIPVLLGVLFQLLLPFFTDIVNLPLASPSLVFIILAALLSLIKFQFLTYDPSIAADRILETMDNGVLIFDHSLTIRYVNEAFVKLSGFTKDELLNMSVSKLDIKLDTTIGFDPNEIDPERHFEIKINTKGNNIKTMLVSFSEYYNELENHAGTIALLTDVTEKHQMQEKLMQEKQQALNYQSMLIGSQLNPHFIFNALNSVQYYILDKSVSDALSYVSEFSTLMCLVLQNSLNNVISLSTEIDFLTKYMELELKRFQDKFNYHIEVKGDLDNEDVFLPPMLIQPYVENAIIHGFSGMTTGGKLEVVFKLMDEKRMKCTVRDNGIGITEDTLNMSQLRKSLSKYPSQGMGLLKKRIEILNEIDEDEYEVKITSTSRKQNSNSGTTVEIFFPIKEGN